MSGSGKAGQSTHIEYSCDDPFKKDRSDCIIKKVDTDQKFSLAHPQQVATKALTLHLLEEHSSRATTRALNWGHLSVIT
ncbi:hypothetical protein KIN20_004225 [Parelaphostrongylus tenuis]|uniref:Uncharacterized protein n=1 Tax=Parelaphostrongylus tenuis TaxID=148309 RepID=A0AAD5M0B4_PARTN|nr:hypothetical protein KIN20_004225 [Parelaphostrongylus tenuis]